MVRHPERDPDLVDVSSDVSCEVRSYVENEAPEQLTGAHVGRVYTQGKEKGHMGAVLSI